MVREKLIEGIFNYSKNNGLIFSEKAEPIECISNTLFAALEAGTDTNEYYKKSVRK